MDCFLQPTQLPFRLYKSVLFPLLYGDLHMTHPELQTLNCNSLLILNKPILLEKYLAVYLF